MRSRYEPKTYEPMASGDDPSEKELRLLSEVYRDPEASQRAVSRRLGIALGLTNLMLRNLATKGYIRVSRAGWRRWLYALTPAGISRKLQLTIAFVQRFLGQYQRVRQMLRREMQDLALNEESRVAVYGTGEFAELVYLALKELAIEEVDIFSLDHQPMRKFLGIWVRDIATLQPEQYDRVVIAELSCPESTVRELQARYVRPEQLVTFFRDQGGNV